MNIGIIVYSYTNNTLKIAQRLEGYLMSKGHSVSVERIKADNENPNSSTFRLTNQPNTQSYDAIIFGTGVRGFDCTPIFKQYIQTIQSLSNKKVAGYVTQYFPFDGMGGNQALSTMTRLIREKDAQLTQLGSVHMKFRSVDKQVESLFNRVTDWLNQ
jgi:flavodoxin